VVEIVVNAYGSRFRTSRHIIKQRSFDLLSRGSTNAFPMARLIFSAQANHWRRLSSAFNGRLFIPREDHGSYERAAWISVVALNLIDALPLHDLATHISIQAGLPFAASC